MSKKVYLENFIYQTNIPNENIIFFESSDFDSGFEIIHDGNSLKAEGKVIFAWLPKPIIKLEVSINLNSINYTDNIPTFANLKLKIPNHDSLLECHVKNWTSKDNTINIKADIKSDIEIGTPSSQLSYVIFHIPNFADFYLDECDEAIMFSNIWKVTVYQNVDFRSIEGMKDKLSSIGGYAISHVGKIEKVDGSNFTSSEVKDLLFVLHYFFAFAKGAWCYPLFPVGYNQNKEQVWKFLYSANVDPWRMDNTWFNKDAKSLIELFPGFIDTWYNNNINDAIFKVAIHLYIESCKIIGSIEISIVLIQIALETLSWNILVTEYSHFTRRDFDIKPADEKIRLLLNKYSIPTNIPPELTELQRLVNNSSISPNISDAPGVINYIRNRIVHGKNQYINTIIHSITEDAKEEAWKLAKWHLELVLLGLFKYRGRYIKSTTYKNRTYLEKGDLVPWG